MKTYLLFFYLLTIVIIQCTNQSKNGNLRVPNDDYFKDESNIDQLIPEIEKEASGFGTFLWVLLIIICILGVVGLGIKFYLKRKENELREERALNPEIQLNTQVLSKDEKVHLAEWAFNPTGPDHLPDVEVANEQSQLGSYQVIQFKQDTNEGRAVISNRPIEKLKDNCYMELEISDVEGAVDIALGLCLKEHYNSHIDPGMTEKGISIHNTGKVYHQKKLRVDYEFNAQFGETIGLGFRFEDGKVWLFYNGKFLNEPFDEKKRSSSRSPPKRNTHKKEEEEDEDKKMEEEIKKEKELAEAGKIEIDHRHTYYPVVFANGNCTLSLNIGGAPFRIIHKEIAKGLL